MGDDLILPADAAIDYESDASFNLTIQAVDSGEIIGSLGIAITVANIDDEAPEFVSFPDTAEIISGTAKFRGEAPIIKAIDDLGDEIGYAFLNTDGTTTDTTMDFAIDHTTGVISATTAAIYHVDDLAANRRILTVRASDRSLESTGDRTVDGDIVIETIFIVDADGDPDMAGVQPIAAIPERAGSSERSVVVSADGDPDMAGVQPIAAIPERAGGAQAIVASLQKTAASGDTTPIENATYSIAATPDGHPFSILGEDLILPADATIDYESDASFNLTIQAVDSGEIIGSLGIAITVANIDDEAPEFVSFPDTAEIISGTAKFRGEAPIIKAIDDLGDEIGYAFLNTDGTTTDTTMDFAIDHTTGVISATTAAIYHVDDLAANRRILTVRASDRSLEATGDRTVDGDIVIETIFIVDADGDGLIEISTLEQLNNIRYNLLGTSYKTSENDDGFSSGCPTLGCNGYELTKSLDFADGASYASGEVNDDWRPAGGDPESASNRGWFPIGSIIEHFNATFEGNGNAIINLYSRGVGNKGLFGIIGKYASIRDTAVIDGSVYGRRNRSGNIGLLAGISYGGTITGCYATGDADGGPGNGCQQRGNRRHGWWTGRVQLRNDYR